jgi:hypothetical protein
MERFNQGEAALGGEGVRKLERLLKVVAVLDQFDTLGEHGAVLFAAVAVGDGDDRLEAVEARGHAHSLAVIAPGGGHHAGQGGLGPLEPIDIDQGPAQLEGADGGVVLVLDPGLGPQALVEQGPGVLGGRRHVTVDHGLGFANFVQRGKHHADRITKNAQPIES